MNGTGIHPGDLIAERYRVEGVLSQGGMGVIVAARHTLMDERVAMKVLRPELTTDPDAIRRFLREGKAAARIRSEHAVRVLDVGILGSGLPFLVMEYLEGRDLAAILRDEGPMAVSRAVGYVLQACEALAEAHALGIVHRDLKPSNLFLARMPGRPELVKVLDFGISKVPLGDDATGTLQTMGTPRYMSPEQMRSSRGVDARSDLWSLGVILYELLSGATPFEADTVPLLCSKVLTDPPRPIADVAPHLPHELALVVMKCLEKEAEQRFSRIDGLVDALVPFSLAQGQVSRARVSLVVTGEAHSSAPSEEALQRAIQPTLGASEIDPTANLPNTRTTPQAAALSADRILAPVAASDAPPALRKGRWLWPLALGGGLLAVAVVATQGREAPASTTHPAAPVLSVQPTHEAASAAPEASAAPGLLGLSPPVGTSAALASVVPVTAAPPGSIPPPSPVVATPKPPTPTKPARPPGKPAAAGGDLYGNRR